MSNQTAAQLPQKTESAAPPADQDLSAIRQQLAELQRQANSPIGRMIEAAAANGDLPTMMQIAEQLARTSFVPKQFGGRPGDVLAAIDYGQTIGLAPMVALQWVAVINGRPSLWGDAMLALCAARGANIVEREIVDEASGELLGWQCTVQRQGRDDVTRRFTFKDAATAGLAGKEGPWRQYPSRMCQMRARGFALRDSCADILLGIQMAEEVRDIEGEVIEHGHKARSPAPEPGTRTQAVLQKARAAAITSRPERQPEQDPQPAETVRTLSFDPEAFLAACEAATTIDEVVALKVQLRDAQPDLDDKEHTRLLSAANTRGRELKKQEPQE